MAVFRAAAIQMRSDLSVEANTDAAERGIRAAAAAGAEYALTPEMTTLLTLDRERLLASISTETTDPSLARFRTLAAELGIHVHIGSMPIKLGEQSVANRSYVIAPDGAILARYDKIHMFDVDLPGGESYRESRLYRSGDRAVVVDLPWLRLGLSICYDLRFPTLYRTLAAAGAQALAIPAAFTRTTGEAHWHVLVRARAIETGSFVIAAAQGGHHEDDRHTFGHSMIVDPWGTVLAEGDSDPGFIVADIDPSASDAARQRIPAVTTDQEFTDPETSPAVRFEPA
ncbi:carbon-nitrogen hydrolase family protein [Bauldia sp.]|uniref:carbon-nitrogen hydrolase family protein n=1 Tax=Bauldia sp. TaxID=2575872 RepID=UPI003BA97276